MNRKQKIRLLLELSKEPEKICFYLLENSQVFQLTENDCWIKTNIVSFAGIETRKSTLVKYNQEKIPGFKGSIISIASLDELQGYLNKCNSQPWELEKQKNEFIPVREFASMIAKLKNMYN